MGGQNAQKFDHVVYGWPQKMMHLVLQSFLNCAYNTALKTDYHILTKKTMIYYFLLYFYIFGKKLDLFFMILNLYFCFLKKIKDRLFWNFEARVQKVKCFCRIFIQLQHSYESPHNNFNISKYLSFWPLASMLYF